MPKCGNQPILERQDSEKLRQSLDLSRRCYRQQLPFEGILGAGLSVSAVFWSKNHGGNMPDILACSAWKLTVKAIYLVLQQYSYERIVSSRVNFG